MAINYQSRARRLRNENARLKAQRDQLATYLQEILTNKERSDTREAAEALLESISA